MSNNPLIPIGRGNPDLASRLSQVEPAQAAPLGPPAEGEAAPRNNPDAKPLPNVSLHFKIDSQTNQVTVLILDKATREVIRTIPPEELKELRQGELLELFR